MMRYYAQNVDTSCMLKYRDSMLKHHVQYIYVMLKMQKCSLQQKHSYM